jgi:hypothetical protein
MRSLTFCDSIKSRCNSFPHFLFYVSRFSLTVLIIGLRAKVANSTASKQRSSIGRQIRKRRPVDQVADVH